MNEFLSHRQLRAPFNIAVLFAVAVTASCGCQQSSELSSIPKPDLSEAYPEVRAFLDQKRKALSANPESARAWGEYAMALDAHEFAGDAIVCYRRAVELNPADSCWKYLLALKIRSEFPEEATKLLSELTDHANVSMAMLLTYSDILADGNRPVAVKKCLEKAARLSPTHPAMLVRLAELALETGDRKLALSHLESLPRQYTESRRLFRKIAPLPPIAEVEPDVATEPLPSVDATISCECCAAVANCRRDPLWRGKLAADKARRGDIQSLEELGVLVEQHPELTGNRISLAFALAHNGQPIEAQHVVAAGIDSETRDTRLFAALGSMAIENGDWEVAETAFQRLVTITPAHWAAWSDLGHVYEQLGRRTDAIAAYDQVLALKPDDTDVQSRRNRLSRDETGVSGK